MNIKYNKSPLKWVGSKNKVLHQLFELDEFKNIKNYDGFVEPFVGAGNVFLNIDNDNIIISDNNEDLIGFYNCVKYQLEKLISVCNELFMDVSKESYYKKRDEFRKTKDLQYKSCLFLYLNRTGFKGLCRYSKKSGFNVPYGYIKQPYFPEIELIFLHEKLQNVNILQPQSFSKTFSECLMDDNFLVYCDPPYCETFSNYTINGFNDKEHELLNTLSVKSKSNIIISNSVEAKRIYTPNRQFDIEVKRGIGSRSIVESIYIY